MSRRAGDERYPSDMPDSESPAAPRLRASRAVAVDLRASRAGALGEIAVLYSYLNFVPTSVTQVRAMTLPLVSNTSDVVSAL